jgi:hypothetical protein
METKTGNYNLRGASLVENGVSYLKKMDEVDIRGVLEKYKQQYAASSDEKEKAMLSFVLENVEVDESGFVSISKDFPLETQSLFELKKAVSYTEPVFGASRFNPTQKRRRLTESSGEDYCHISLQFFDEDIVKQLTEARSKIEDLNQSIKKKNVLIQEAHSDAKKELHELSRRLGLSSNYKLAGQEFFKDAQTKVSFHPRSNK